MARIICHVSRQPGRITLTWSEGAAAFEPYHLAGQEVENVNQAAAEAWAALRRVADSDSPAESASLGQAGHRLYRALFRMDEEEGGVAREVEQWLEQLRQQNAVETLEILGSTPGQIPWNVVCDTTGQEMNQGFWAVRYSLSVGRRVNPLRCAILTDTPVTMIVADPAALDGALRQWAQDRQAALITSLDQLEDGLDDHAPDVIYVAAPVDAGAFKVAGQRLTVDDLRGLLAASGGNPYPVVVVEPREVTADAWAPMLAELAANVPGLVTCVTPLPADVGGELLRGVLGDWLTDRRPLGDVLRRARQNLGLRGLSLTNFAPAHLRHPTPGEDITDPLPPLDLPEQPYRPLKAFDRTDRALFSGREMEIAQVAQLFDHTESHGVILHGPGGGGKTSLLQAGVFPFLEEEAVGYRVLRNRLRDDEATAENDRPILAIRPGGDLMGQVAQALAAFCDQPLTTTTPTGRSVTIDLPALLAQAMHGNATRPDLASAIQASSPTAIAEADTPVSAPSSMASSESSDEPSPALRLYRKLSKGGPAALARVLDLITRDLPFDLVLWIEQGEELIVLAPPSDAQRQLALEQVQGVLQGSARCRVILSVRTDFLGRFRNLLPRGAGSQWQEFFLPELTEEQVKAVLALPTSTEPVPRCGEIPATKYQFSFEPGLLDELIKQSRATGTQLGPWALANLQALCSDLVTKIKRRKESLIRKGDVKELKGPKEALVRHLDLRLRDLAVPAKDRNNLRSLIRRLSQPQADGTAVRTLLVDHEAVTTWPPQGQAGVEAAITAAEEAGLIEVHQLVVNGGEGLYLGLPQDSLARLGDEHQESERARAVARSRAVDMLWGLIPLGVLACAVTVFIMRRVGAGGGGVSGERLREAAKHLQKDFEQRVQQLRPSLYNATMAQAQQAIANGDALRARQHLLSLQPANADQDDLRGFDWYLLWKQINGERRTLVGHQASIEATALSHDGKVLASASSDGVVKMWNPETGLENAVLKGHQGAVHSLTFAADGKTLASAGADQSIRLWDVPPAAKDILVVDKARQTLSGHTGAVLTVAFGKDPKALASGGADGAVILWNLDKGKEEKVFKDHAGPVRSVAFSPDGNKLASAGADQTIRVREAAGGKELQTIKTEGTVAALAFHPDGILLAAGNADKPGGLTQGKVRVWDSATGKLLHDLFAHGAGVLSLAFMADGKTLISSGQDYAIRFWNLDNTHVHHTQLGHFGWVNSLALSRDGTTLASGSRDQTVKIWDVAVIANPAVVNPGGEPVQSLAVNAQGTLVAAGHPSGVVKIWDLATRKMVAELTGHGGNVTALAFTNGADATKLAVASASANQDSGDVKVYDVTGKAKDGYQTKLVHTLRDHGKGVLCLAFAADDKTLATGSADKSAILWDVGKGKARKVLTGHKDRVACLGFNHNGKYLATGSGRTIHVWDADGKVIHKPLEVQSGDLVALNLVEVDTVITAGMDNAVNSWIWFEEGPRLTHSVRPHSQPLSALILFPKDPVASLATASLDSAVAISDMRQGERLRLTGHTGPVRALAINPDGQFLVSGGQDGAIRLWRAASPRDLK